MGMDNRNNNNTGGEHVIDLISAYIDNALDAGDRERVRAHIAACELCGAEHRELQATQQLLRAMPVQAPPRVFTLTEEMAGIRPRVEARPSLLSRLLGKALAPRLATGSALAFALLLLMLVSDLGLLNQGMTSGIVSPTSSKVGAENGSLEQQSIPMALSAPTSAAAAGGEMDPLADQSTPVSEGDAGGGTAIESPSGTDQANQAPPQATPEAMAGDATATTAAGAPGDRQLAYEATAEAAAGDRATGTEADGTPLPGPDEAYNRFQAAPGEEEDAANREPVARFDDGSWSGFPVTLALELGLGVLAVGLAIGAILARRRGA